MEPTITDWISALSTLGTMLVAGVTAYLTYKTYLASPVQEEAPEIDDQQSVDGGVESTVVVFDTRKQKTTLKVKCGGLECHLENKDGQKMKRENPQWRFSAEQCVRFLSYEDFSVNPGYKVRTGLFSVGPRKNWLYSKKLFGDPHNLNQTIARLLKEASKDGAEILSNNS